MNRRVAWTFFFLCLCSLDALAQSRQSAFDPIKELSKAFPDTVEIKNNGRLLEFCPDGTCDGFVTSGNMSVPALKDFAYLYVYFFSDYTILDEWRGKVEAKEIAVEVLSNPEYLSCRSENDREAARCVLRNLSRDGRVKLIFIRYDEGARNVVHEDLAARLSQK
jgi:hypothetical protein